MQESSPLSWDDLRFVLALAEAGSLAKAARRLGVDHTTVGRRITAAETALGARLFTHAPTGYTLTPDGERLLGPIRSVEDAVLAVERAAASGLGGLDGPVRITSPETFGVAYLAPRLAAFGRSHPGLTLELAPSGEVLDLGRREADVAVRFFRSRPQSLVVRRVAEVGYGLYASPDYLAAHPVDGPDDLANHRLLAPPTSPTATDARWLAGLSRGARPAFVSDLTLALIGAAHAHAGVAVLPRYLGDPDPGLTHLPMPDAPVDVVWLTVHQDLKDTPRVRVVLDFLAAAMKDDRALLRGS